MEKQKRNLHKWLMKIGDVWIYYGVKFRLIEIQEEHVRLLNMDGAPHFKRIAKDELLAAGILANEEFSSVPCL